MITNELAEEIHLNAVAHGWWDEPRTFGDIIALCHSELSEALEEFRDSKPNLYYNCMGFGENRGMAIRDIDCYVDEIQCITTDCTWCDKKPEGVAVELADCAIRILDAFGMRGIEVNIITIYDRVAKTFGDFITECHCALSFAYQLQNYAYLNDCLSWIYKWAEENNVDMDEIIRIKHEFNKTRPFRHGGKAL